MVRWIKQSFFFPFFLGDDERNANKFAHDRGDGNITSFDVLISPDISDSVFGFYFL